MIWVMTPYSNELLGEVRTRKERKGFHSQVAYISIPSMDKSWLADGEVNHEPGGK